MESFINEKILSSTINIPILKLTKTKNIDGLVKQEFKNNNEKICNSEGYILKNSIQIIQRSVGKVLNINSESFIQYKINYKFKYIYPSKDDILECVVDSISKMGIIGYLNFTDSEEDNITIKNSPILIIIPNEFLSDKDIKINDKINISVLDSRIKYRAIQMQIVGKIV